MSSDALVQIALNQTAQLERKTGENSYGEPIYGAPETIACRISAKHRLVLIKDGKEVTSGAQLTTFADVEVEDRITVDGLALPVLAVSRPATFSGKEHRRKVYI